MDINVHHFFHFGSTGSGFERLLQTLVLQGERIMATQAEIAAQLTAVKDQLVKVGTETSTLLTKIDELKAIVANGPVSPELQAAVDAVAAQAGIVDEMCPDGEPMPPVSGK